jgi:hypothetical protein
MSLRSILFAGAALAVAAAPAAHAATALYATNNGGLTQSNSGPGLATVSHSDSAKFGTASGYEFLGGVGVSAFAHTSSGNGYQNMQVVSTAGFADAFRVGPSTRGLFDEGAGVFQLTFSMQVSGSVDAQGTLEPPEYPFDIYSSAIGAYSYSWNVGGHTGGGGVDLRFNSNGLSQVDVTGDGPAGTFGAVLFVRLNDVVNLNLFARSSAVADGRAQATGMADFGHTLRWGGITNVAFIPDGGAGPIDLPDDFQLSLVSGGTGFDYWNAAGPNPYTSGGVPEPGAWTLMILGFLATGSAIRARRRGLVGA